MVKKSLIHADLGPWHIERRRGAGGMGTVYLATSGDRRAAIKVIHAHLLSEAGFFKRFLREAEIGKAIAHENVVRVVDADALGAQPITYATANWSPPCGEVVCDGAAHVARIVSRRWTCSRAEMTPTTARSRGGGARSASRAFVQA